MGTRRTWLLFIVVLAFGLLMEGLKQWSASTPRQASKIPGLALLDMDVKPFTVDSQRNSTLSQARAKGIRLSGTREAIDGMHDFGATHEVAEKAKIAKVDKDKNKKKKKKKKKETAEMIVQQSPRPYYREEDPNSNLNENKFVQTTTTIMEAQAEEKSKDLPVTYEDWAELILGTPNRDEVLRLIDFYRTGIVTPDIFYALLIAMLEEPNDGQHLLAIEAAGGVPSPSSFVFLITALKTLDQGSDASGAAMLRMNDYQSMANVVHLRPVLQSHLNDASIVGDAVRTLDQSTEQNISQSDRAPSDVTRGGGAPGTPAPTPDPAIDTTPAARRNHEVSQVYLPFESILERVVAVHAGNSDISQAASRSLERIRTLKNVVLAEVNQ